ncbi:MAG: fatty acyl-AMP ligase, partial [Cyanobacteria bacterium P01_F01_bin.143]
MLTLPQLLLQRSSTEPDKTAYIFLRNGEKESARLTYRQLDEQARAIAASLQHWQGERALLLYASELDFIVAFFGCLYAGVVAVPAYPPRRNQKLSRLRAIASDAQIAIALTTAVVLDKINCRWQEEPLLAKLNWLATDQLSTTAEDWSPQVITPDQLAFLQYTSGSTGTPKGVMVNHRNIIHNSQIIKQNFGHTQETIFVGWLPLFHDMGLIGNVLQPMYLGIPCILMPPIAFLQKPIRWLKAIDRYRATTSGGPNFAYDLCVQRIKSEQLAGLDLSSWTVAFNGGEPVRAKTLERFTNTFAEHGFRPQVFHPCYGMAENTLFISGGVISQEPQLCLVEAAELEQNRVVHTEVTSYSSLKSTGGDKQEFNKSTLVSSGGSWQGQKIVIAKVESLTQCGEGEVGEIWISGDSVAQGYWNCTEATQNSFHAYLTDTGEGPFLRTGDLGFVLNGELFVTGRLKDVIIIRGQNYYPQDIELTVESS